MTAAAAVDAEVMAVEEVAAAMVVEDTEVADDFGLIRFSISMTRKVEKLTKVAAVVAVMGAVVTVVEAATEVRFEVSDLLSPSHKYFDP